MKNQFIQPNEIEPYYPEISVAYKEAFAGPPWYEVSKCPNPKQQGTECSGGPYCDLMPGQFCATCNAQVVDPAYIVDGLAAGWRDLYTEVERPIWYLETTDDSRIALAALAWQTNARQLGQLKYNDNEQMMKFLIQRFGDQPIGYLDEIFANKAVRASGNLKRFRMMTAKVMDLMGVEVLTYRTITPQMITEAQKLGATVLDRNREVPDRRDFIIIERGEE